MRKMRGKIRKVRILQIKIRKTIRFSLPNVFTYEIR